MRKTIIAPSAPTHDQPDVQWLNVPDIAHIAITSEAPDYPIENVFALTATSGWRAATSGPQILNLTFDQPQDLKCIWLKFIETEHQRTQEFLLSYSKDQGQIFHELVRQQWNFNPQNATQEIENIQVDLTAVTTLQLVITPDMSNSPLTASLCEWRMA
ncbi:carbohydrate-binding protein [Thiosulfativibrio zosterae]|uniref:Carbohydrate-binding protein n=1 Tax=Thiosulfativibrio zosterae TaxID=2675053 RepID=A0A6F8PP46_9GAMM|nr:carbohydrate-binding protein [Thiosulfativibrio zosterae]BBP43846.1 hypothetical protein THMIRHAT_15920 [Thiosulfativibrio zosterae]